MQVIKEKFTWWAIVALLTVIALGMLIGSYIIINRSTNTTQLTLERVLDDQQMRSSFGIVNKIKPEDYGLNAEEVVFPSADKTTLSGWFIRSKDSTVQECMVLVHGLQSNRLATLQFLGMFQELGKDQAFHFLLLDLRNAGNSGPGDPLMGYKYAEDIASALVAIQAKEKIRRFTLYGTGAGALGTLVALNRQDLGLFLQQRGVTVTRLIMDSPLSNVEEYIRRKTDSPSEFLLKAALWGFNRKIQGYMEGMRLRTLAKRPDLSVLILQNIGDEVAPTDILLSEIDQLPNISLELFDGEEHAGMLQHPVYRQRYKKAVAAFLKETSE
jgi:pimeloyl-ACP methyl ester carboxylesterase